MKIVSLLLVGFLTMGLGGLMFKGSLAENGSELQGFVGSVSFYFGLCMFLIGCFAGGVKIGNEKPE